MSYTTKDFKNMIRYEDNFLLVVFKPAGLAVESRRVTQQDLEGLARLWRMEEGENPEIYPIQRLDQPVEGLMVLAKTKKAASTISGELQKGQLKKCYRAKVSGTVPSEEGELVNILIPDRASNKTLVLDTDQKEIAKGKESGKNPKSSGKRAVLAYRQVNDHEVEIDLKTGRHHQIRAQLAHAGMPIIGDTKYGGPAAERLCLSSCRLTLVHPMTHKKMTWSATPSWEESN